MRKRNENLLRVIGRITTLIPRWAYPVLRGHLKGVKFVFGSHAGECGGISVYANCAEPEQLDALSNALQPGQVFFDIGANVGLYTMLASRGVGPTGKVIAIEPDVRNLSHLYKHACLNKATNITILPGACADQCKLQVFVFGTNYATGHLAQEGNMCTDQSVPVLCVSVDAIVDTMDVMPDIMKIDVEGAEMDVLKGAENVLRRRKPKIFLSTHSKELRSGCIDYLEKLGYQIKPLIKDISHASEFVAT
jgi:FkbM family methyltransferase